MTRLISPSEVEERTGFSPDMLRDWRRRGILTTGTLQANGRWGYVVGDVAQLAIVNLLTKWRIVSDLTDAFHIADFAVPYVYACVANDPHFKEKVGKLPYLVAFNVRAGERTQVVAHWDIKDIFELRIPGFVIIDTERLALELQEPLAGLFDAV